jgi:hypothetical protein
MLNSNPVVALARSFDSRGQEVDERIDVLVLRGVFANAAEQTAAVELCQAIASPFVSAQVYDAAIGGDIGPDEDFDLARVVTVTIVKRVVDGVATFVFGWAAVQHIEKETPAKQIACFELESRATFLCRGLKVETWRLDQIFDTPATAVAISPRKLVKDFVPGREVTDDLSPWLLLQAPAVTSNIYEAWCRQAARRVLGGLVNVASQEDGQVWLQASGPPMFRIVATNPMLETGLEELTKGAEWVYLTGHDLDTRHLIFAVELARAYRPAVPFIEVVRQARESAATTYEAHVQSASRETLKALADLRKTIIDETQKITQRAQDLTSGLWRDLAVSASPFALKILGDAAKLPNIGISAGFYFAAAIFIAMSFGLQVRINGAYLENQRQARAKWFETLYAIISPTERRTIAEDPIKKAEAAYKETRLFVGIIYGVLVAILIGFGISTLWMQPNASAMPPIQQTNEKSATHIPSLTPPQLPAPNTQAPTTSNPTHQLSPATKKRAKSD